jgi:hypothetical protein
MVHWCGLMPCDRRSLQLLQSLQNVHNLNGMCVGVVFGAEGRASIGAFAVGTAVAAGKRKSGAGGTEKNVLSIGNSRCTRRFRGGGCNGLAKLRLLATRGPGRVRVGVVSNLLVALLTLHANRARTVGLHVRGCRSSALVDHLGLESSRGTLRGAAGHTLRRHTHAHAHPLATQIKLIKLIRWTAGSFRCASPVEASGARSKVEVERRRSGATCRGILASTLYEDALRKHTRAREPAPGGVRSRRWAPALSSRLEKKSPSKQQARSAARRFPVHRRW